MSVASEITRLNTAKADIKEAIEGYGVTVPSTDTMDTYAAKMAGIAGGEWLPSASTILATFARRQSGGDGPATIEKIYGKTGIFRQLRRNIAGTFTADGVTTSYDASTGKVCIHNDSRTAPYSSGSSQIYLTDATFPALVGHKIAILFSVQDSSIGVTNPSGIYLGSTIMTLTDAMLRLRIDATYDFVNAQPVGSDYYFYVNFIDLTDYFGAGNEPTTIAEVRKYFPADYYPYDAGSLLPVKAEKIVTRGVNQWDEEWESGRYNNNTGAKEPANDRIRNANLIPVLPGVAYYKNAFVSNVYYYDINKQFISYGNTNDRIFTTPANCYYIAWMTFSTYGTTYNHDICINISDSSINGQYFPHHNSDVGLPILKYFPDGLLGVGDIKDEITPKKAIQRMGRVDLGSLNWRYLSTAGHLYFEATSMPAKMPKIIDSADASYNIVCPKYNGDTWRHIYGNTTDKSIGIYHNTKAFVVYDSAYTDATTFKAAMSGVYLDYELDDPIETDINEDMTYLPQLGGTEEVSPISAEFKAEIRYARKINE